MPLRYWYYALYINLSCQKFSASPHAYSVKHDTKSACKPYTQCENGSVVHLHVGIVDINETVTFYSLSFKSVFRQQTLTVLGLALLKYNIVAVDG